MENNNFKPTQPILLRDYCPRATALTVKDLIKEAVQREDLINHSAPARVEIPKMQYPKSCLKNASLYAFMRGFLP